MIEFFHRQSRRVRRLCRFAAVVLRERARLRRLQRSGPDTLETRLRLLQDWGRDSLAALDVQVTIEGSPPSGGLLASNHLSYLDILVYCSVLPCAFVSKAEVRRWPFFGDFADYSGTIFVPREDRVALRNANQRVADYLKAGIAVVLFPEGTTTDGSQVLRFHSSMLQPAIDAAVAVTPCAVSYALADGAESEAAWWGDMKLAPQFLNLCGKRGIRAIVTFGEPLQALDNRRTVGDLARDKVVALRNRPLSL
jgi:1-acyl-sn-glycerol-3-phosphate acyltransferase